MLQYIGQLLCAAEVLVEQHERPVLVEIVDLEYSYARTIAHRERDRKLVNVNGHRAQCGPWDEEEEMYVVQTFEGIQVCVPRENLREVDVPRAEDGGFDLLWQASN